MFAERFSQAHTNNSGCIHLHFAERFSMSDMLAHDTVFKISITTSHTVISLLWKALEFSIIFLHRHLLHGGAGRLWERWPCPWVARAFIRCYLSTFNFRHSERQALQQVLEVAHFCKCRKIMENSIIWQKTNVYRLNTMFLHLTPPPRGS